MTGLDTSCWWVAGLCDLREDQDWMETGSQLHRHKIEVLWVCTLELTNRKFTPRTCLSHFEHLFFSIIFVSSLLTDLSINVCLTCMQEGSQKFLSGRTVAKPSLLGLWARCTESDLRLLPLCILRETAVGGRLSRTAPWRIGLHLQVCFLPDDFSILSL